jgi:multiple sugar transport system substrate-binding protein
MKKKLFLLVALTLVLCVALIVAGCKTDTGSGDGGGDVAEGTKITVILPDNEADNVGLHAARTKQFTEETGIEVELINKGWEAVADDVLADLASGGGSYDVIEFDNAWIAKFIENGWVAPLDEYMTEDIKSGMVPGLLDLFSSDGQHYGIVWNNDTRFYMYNTALLDEAGVDAPPKTWAEVADLSAKTKSVAYLDTYKQEQMGTNQLMFAVYSFGGEFVDADGNPIVSTDPGVKEAYTWLAQAYKDGVFGPSSLTIDYEEVAQSFFIGEFPLFLQAWPGVYADSNNEEMSKIVGDIAVAEYSVSKTGDEQVVLTLPEAMAITSTSQNKEAAWKYIEYMSSKEFDKEKALKIGMLPIWSDNYNDAELLELYPYWEQFGMQADNARGYPSILWVEDFAEIVAKVSQKILAGNIGVQEGLDEMQKLMEDAKAAAEL